MSARRDARVRRALRQGEGALAPPVSELLGGVEEGAVPDGEPLLGALPDGEEEGVPAGVSPLLGADAPACSSPVEERGALPLGAAFELPPPLAGVLGLAVVVAGVPVSGTAPCEAAPPAA